MANIDIKTSLGGKAAKTTPVDADKFHLNDSSAADALKTVTWSNIKATSKSYFDTLYQAIGGGTGDVVGPASAVDNALARFNTTTGKLLQNSLFIVDDNGGVSHVLANAATVGHLIKLAAAASGNAFEVQPNGSTTPLTHIAANGSINIANLGTNVRKILLGNIVGDAGIIATGVNSNGEWRLESDGSDLRQILTNTNGAFSFNSLGTSTGFKIQEQNINRQIFNIKKTLVNNTVTSLFEVALPTLKATGGIIKATVVAINATDVQSREQLLRYEAVNKAGAYTTAITTISEGVAASTGTLTGTWTVLAGTDKITIELNANSSLTPTTLYIAYSIENNSEQATTLV